ncbi:MAG: hypothetical protein DLD55_03400, partial [candidate division SR1 bacterium]
NKLLELEGIQDFDDSLIGQALKLSYITSSRSAIALLTTTYLFVRCFQVLLHLKPKVFLAHG